MSDPLTETMSDVWARGPYSTRGTVGLLTPPANTTLEPELSALLPPGLSLHASRLPGRVAEDTAIGLRERFAGYHETLADSADTFGGLPLDALVYGVTGSTYLINRDEELALSGALRAGGARHVNTAAGAIQQVLRALDVHTVALVTPYPDWLTEAAIAYWRERDFAVASVAAARAAGSIYAIPTPNVLAAVAALDLTGVDAVILSGTGMPTIEPIMLLGEELDVPVLSSTACLAWWVTGVLAPDAFSHAHSIVQRIRTEAQE